MAKLSTELQQYFFSDRRAAEVTLSDILTLAGERAFGFLFVLLALPSALPIPAPGYSIPFGIVMLVLALQLVRGKTRPWLPKRWLRRSISLVKVQGFLKAGVPWLQRLEALCRPRFKTICTSIPGRTVLGIAIALMSISMMIPIPGTNTVPAMGIFIVGLGLLEDDGAIASAGLGVCTLGLTLTTAIFLLGYEVVKAALLSLFGAVR